MENKIHPWHGVAHGLWISHISNIEFYFFATSGCFACRSWRMSSCFFSSREKMRISPMSEYKKCFRTVCPKLPVPPVISRVALLKLVIVYLLSVCKNMHSSLLSIYFNNYCLRITATCSFRIDKIQWHFSISLVFIFFTLPDMLPPTAHTTE